MRMSAHPMQIIRRFVPTPSKINRLSSNCRAIISTWKPFDSLIRCAFMCNRVPDAYLPNFSSSRQDRSPSTRRFCITSLASRAGQRSTAECQRCTKPKCLASSLLCSTFCSGPFSDSANKNNINIKKKEHTHTGEQKTLNLS